MRDEITRTIQAKQEIYVPDCDRHEIVDALIIRKLDMNVLEEWIADSCGIEVIYDVQLIQREPTGAPKQFNVTRRP